MIVLLHVLTMNLVDHFESIDNAAVDLLNHIAKTRGLKMMDLPRAMWYANTLSGGTTPLHIGLDNIGSLAGNFAARALRRPGGLRQREEEGREFRHAGRSRLVREVSGATDGRRRTRRRRR